MLQMNASASAGQRRVPVYLVDSTTGAPATGLTFAAGEVKLSKNGAAETNAGAMAEIAGGLYYYEASAGDLDSPGFFTLRIAKTGVQQFVALVQVSSLNVYDSASLGASRLDAAISTLPSAAAIATAVWGAGTRTLTAISDSAGITTLLSRIASALTINAGAVTVGTNNDKTGYSLTVAPPTAAAIRTEIDSNSTRLASLDGTKLTTARATALDNLDASVQSRMATFAYTAPPSAASIRAEIDSNSTILAAIKQVTDTLGLNAIADAVLKRDWSLITGEASRCLLNAGRAIRNGFSTSGNTLSILKEDGSTAYTRTITTSSSAQPIIGVGE